VDIDPNAWRARHERMGRVNYEAYAEQVGGVSVAGDPLPTWDEMTEQNQAIALAWQHGAMAVVRANEAEQRDAQTGPA
jgi:hypothetical protein